MLTRLLGKRMDQAQGAHRCVMIGSMTRMSHIIACMALKRTKWCSFLLRTTTKNTKKKMSRGTNWFTSYARCQGPAET